jgi:hypothetical protein
MNAPAATTLNAPWADSEPATDEARPVRTLSLPSPEAALVYGWRWWADTLPGLLGRHRLFPRRAGRYAARFQASDGLRGRYGELFDLRPAGPDSDSPFLLAQGVITLLQSRIWSDLGINRRHLQHLRHRLRPLAGAVVSSSTPTQVLDCRLQRVVRITPTEVLALLETRICDDDGRPLALVEDAYVVRDLQVAYAVQATEDDLLRRAVSRMRRRIAEIDPRQHGVRTRQLYIAPDAGRRFARLSGERSPVHSSRLGARLMGQRRPFVQGMYLRNLIARELAEWGLAPGSLQLTFTGKACLGHTLRLMLQDDAFEVVDERGHLVAFGRT